MSVIFKPRENPTVKTATVHPLIGFRVGMHIAYSTQSVFLFFSVSIMVMMMTSDEIDVDDDDGDVENFCWVRGH